MKAWLALGTAAALAACAAGPRDGIRIPFVVSPTAVVTADIAQNRLAAEEGVIKALRKTAAKGAIVFAPGPIDADTWLRAQEPFAPTRWSPHAVFLSCDGKTGVSTGAIRWGDTDGYYTTIWRYFAKNRESGDWRWVLSHGDRVDTPRAEPDIVRSRVASCDGAPTRAGTISPTEFSTDGTLRYVWSYDPAQGRRLAVALWNGSAYETVLEDVVVGG